MITTKELGGGKFANGAITGTFAYLLSTGMDLKKLGNDALSLGKTFSTDIMATVYGSIYGQFFSKTGILASAYESISSLITLDFKGFGIGLAHLQDSLVLRYGRYAGPAWGNAKRGRTTSKKPYNNAIDKAAYTHDDSYMNSYGLPNATSLRNQADFQFIKDMWGTPQPGIFGQVYRLVATPVFVIKGSL